MINQYYYDIVGQKVLVKQDWAAESLMFHGFRGDAAEKPDFQAEIFHDRRIFEKCYGIEYFRPGKSSCIFASSAHPEIRMTISGDGAHAVIEGGKYSNDGVMELFLTAFYSFLAKKGGVLVHASLVRFRDEALMFAGDSGVGKTTQAELWKKYMNAEILNGDKVFLTDGGAGCEAWGSPWKGSSAYAKNQKARLKAIVLLEQKKTNMIKKLSQLEIQAQFFPHIFYPMWDQECTEKVMETLDRCLWEIPVFRLSCRPDQEAVELTCREIWGTCRR